MTTKHGFTYNDMAACTQLHASPLEDNVVFSAKVLMILKMKDQSRQKGFGDIKCLQEAVISLLSPLRNPGRIVFCPKILS